MRGNIKFFCLVHDTNVVNDPIFIDRKYEVVQREYFFDKLVKQSGAQFVYKITFCNPTKGNFVTNEFSQDEITFCNPQKLNLDFILSEFSHAEIDRWINFSGEKIRLLLAAVHIHCITRMGDHIDVLRIIAKHSAPPIFCIGISKRLLGGPAAQEYFCKQLFAARALHASTKK